MIEILNQIALYSGYLLWASLIFFSLIIIIEDINLKRLEKKKLKGLAIPYIKLQKKILDKPINFNKKMCFLLWNDCDYDSIQAIDVLSKEYNIIMVLEPYNKNLDLELRLIKNNFNSKISFVVFYLPKNVNHKMLRYNNDKSLSYYEYIE